MSEIASLMQRAARYLDSARLLLGKGDNESSVSRTYYAMFFAAQAVLLTSGPLLERPERPLDFVAPPAAHLIQPHTL